MQKYAKKNRKWQCETKVGRSATQDQGGHAWATTTPREITTRTKQLQENTDETEDKTYRRIQENRQNKALPELSTMARKYQNREIIMGYLQIQKPGRSGGRRRVP